MTRSFLKGERKPICGLTGVVLSGVILMTGATSAKADLLSGSIQIWGGPLEVNGEEADQRDEKYRFELSRELTRWLRLSASYRSTDFRTEADTGAIFDRRTSEPRLDIVYDRPVFLARFSAWDRAVRSSNEIQSFELTSRIAQLEWRPLERFRMTASYIDESNIADSSVFGRDTDSSELEVAAILDREYWTVQLLARSTSIDNNATGFELDQDRQELRLSYNRRFLEERLLVSFYGLGGRLDQVQRRSAGAGLARPLPASEGLFAIDTSPEVGELGPAPGLIDGDVDSPAFPRIDVGGANTFRNVGVDLGLSRTVSRIEITVDGVSDPGVQWQVFHGPDNLTWMSVPVIRAEYDEALLRYTLFIPATTDRFFKAVNVTLNSISEVAITEVRALEDVESLGRVDGDSTTYHSVLRLGWQATKRVRASFATTLRNEEDLAAGFLSRDLDETSYEAGLRVLLAEAMTLRLDYQFSDISENLEPKIERQQERLSALLEWSPLPAINLSFLAATREERNDDLLIRSSDTFRLSAVTEFLPDLRLTSTITFSESDDPFTGFSQSNWQWREYLEARPTERWVLSGSFSHTSYDASGSFALRERTSVDLRSTWLLTPYLTLTGDWAFADDDRQETLTERYSLSWSPGRKLFASLTAQETETKQLRRTSGLSTSVSYRVNPWARLWLNVTRSELEQVGAAPSETETARLGVNLFF